ncbi:MAG: carbamoyltransferase HypF [Candidatus Velthaea sp.]
MDSHGGLARLALEVRVRGTVQGVGFRPTMWRLAHACGVTGDIRNDADGVLMHVSGELRAVERFLSLVRSEAPPLARIASIDTRPAVLPVAADDFRIVESRAGRVRTQIAADAVVCAACRAEVFDPADRRFGYPFANCTHCGPRLSIVTRVPYDRPNTTMAPFELCAACRAEYEDPADRRFHAQPIACPRCGPRATLEPFAAAGSSSLDCGAAVDAVDAARALLQSGSILAIKGLGGFQLACDATNAQAVGALRARKVREEKPFALMAFDLDVIRRYCTPAAHEIALLASPASPIVLLTADGPERLPAAVAPGMRSLGFMLPSTPLHALLLRGFDRPVIMTSGNRSSEPQVIDNAEARDRLGAIADYALVHDRAIANRVDDSVVRYGAGAPRVLRRARGYAPEPIPLPPGFERAPSILALGAELKSTFCLVIDGAAVVAQHQGDLEDAATFADFQHNLQLYEQLFDRAPALLALDRHPEYLSTKYGRDRAERDGLPVVDVQHHHAHVASVLAEHGRPLDAPPVLGIALDGLGYGDAGELWGGEFLLADYRSYRRLGRFKPFVLLGGAQAMREPWRNTYAQLMAALGWPAFAERYAGLELCAFLAAKPRAALDAMTARGLNSPPASSCGRLFDAVGAALGLARERATFEGQAAMLLEALAERDAARRDGADVYPFAIERPPGGGLPQIEPQPMWLALLEDLRLGVPPSRIAARFHAGLAQAIAALAIAVTRGEFAAGPPADTVALSGGCFQNGLLLEGVGALLEAAGFRVLANVRVPANDGGIALGQAAIAAATWLSDPETERRGPA